MVQGINKGGIDKNNINSTGQNISANAQQLPFTSQEQIELNAEVNANKKKGSTRADIDSYIHAYIAQLVSDRCCFCLYVLSTVSSFLQQVFVNCTVFDCFSW